MTTAADIRKELENSMTCFGIDDWIDSYLLKEFMASGGAKVSVRVRGWVLVSRRTIRDNDRQHKRG